MKDINKQFELKHSPSPWRQDGDIVVDANGEVVIDDENNGSMVAFGAGEEGMGDKALVVSAPDMFRLLRKVYLKLSDSEKEAADGKEIYKLLLKIAAKDGISDYKFF